VWDTWLYQAPNFVGPQRIGPLWSYHDDAVNGDVGIIRITDSYWSLGGTASKIAAWTTGNGNYQVYGGAYSYYGLSLCRYGATTARKCGTDNDPSQINATIDGDAHETYNTACSNAGDSGGTFVAANQGYGLVSFGVAGNCPASGTWYTEVVPAANTVNVHVAYGGP
jgi:streptogrisin C